MNKWLKSALKPTRLWYKIVYWETMTINIFKLRKNYFCFIQGCYSFFPIFFSGFPNFFKVFKSTHFWTKAKFNVKTVLNTIKNIERYCKVTLNVFYNKKIFDDDKKISFIWKIFVSNRIFTTEHVKIVKNSSFFFLNFSNYRFFQVFFA